MRFDEVGLFRRAPPPHAPSAEPPQGPATSGARRVLASPDRPSHAAGGEAIGRPATCAPAQSADDAASPRRAIAAPAREPPPHEAPDADATHTAGARADERPTPDAAAPQRIPVMFARAQRAPPSAPPPSAPPSSAAGAAPARAMVAAGDASAVALTVHACIDDDWRKGVTIVISDPGFHAPQGARLRRALDAAAARHGVNIAQLITNGLNLHTQAFTTGAAHGGLTG